MFSCTGSIRLTNEWLRRSRYRLIALVAGVTALVAGGSQVQAQADGPVAAYAFSETSGTTAVDASGHGHDGALVNEAMWTTGRFGGGLRLDGVDDSRYTYRSSRTIRLWRLR